MSISLLRSSRLFSRLSASRRLTTVTFRTATACYRVRFMSTSSAAPLDADDPRNAPRDAMEYDVVVVGAGPAGLSTAIRLKQLSQQHGKEINVCVVEKGTEVGAHVLSGNVFEPHALDELIPDWKSKENPLQTPVKEDKFFFLTKTSAIPMPVPPSLHNEGNYIISLGSLCKWLATEAETLGVEIFPGFAAAEVLYNEDNSVAGIATGDMGIGKDGTPRDTFQRGMELRAKQTVFAEGVRGNLSELVIDKFQLRKNCDPQTYGLGVKEIWEIDPSKHHLGRVMHTLGWPSRTDTWSGTFMYHAENNRIYLGMVIGLDYSNPYTSPYQELQTWKQHPHIRQILEGGKIIEYGARCINEGGFQSVPKVTMPGGVLVGCTAGFVNVPKIKGSHNAMKTGMLAAEAIYEQHTKGELGGVELTDYETNLRNSWVMKELYSVRNYHPSFKFAGLYGMMAYSALESFILRGKGPWTFRNTIPDHLKTKKASEVTPIEYPKPDGVISFDLLTNLQRSGVRHNEDQPSHLKVRSEKSSSPLKSFKEYAGPEGRFCPAKVYEYLQDDNGNVKLQINNTNCVHCKTCAIKTTDNFINWTVPEGGGGPNYSGM